MRYYIDSLNTPNINELVEYLKSNYNEKILLGHDGYYKYIKDELYKFKLCDFNQENDVVIKINNINLTGTNLYWKKCEKKFNIPFEFIPIEKSIYKFSLNDNTYFIAEKMGNKITDFYFTSNYDVDNFFFKEDIISFLSILKKYL